MKVAAIIPAYNEETTIGQVIDTVKRVDLVDEVIVVSDGSTDSTTDVALRRGVIVVDLENNIGKGGAMMKGLEKTDHSIILFLDADLIGLNEKHIYNLLSPVINDGVAMTIGVFESGRVATNLAQKLVPCLSGQRALRREILEDISHLNVSRFGVEVALTKYAEEKGIKVQEVILPYLTHLMKEEKLGLVKGFVARMKMYWEIAKYVRKG